MTRALALCALVATACATAPTPTPETEEPTSGRLAYTELSNDLFVEEVTEGVIRFVSFKDNYDKPVAMNGLLILAPRGTVMIDTPWTNQQAKLLADWSRKRHHRELRDVIITHAHKDRFSGVRALLAIGATIRALPRTIALADAQRWGGDKDALPVPTQPLGTDETIELAGEPLGIFFPGHAHSPDNLVVWIPSRRVLFGGGVVVATGDTTLGPLEEASPESWRAAIGKLIARYPTVEHVVPAQGDPGTREVLLHTQRLVTAKSIEPSR